MGKADPVAKIKVSVIAFNNEPEPRSRTTKQVLSEIQRLKPAMPDSYFVEATILIESIPPGFSVSGEFNYMSIRVVSVSIPVSWPITICCFVSLISLNKSDTVIVRDESSRN